MNPETQQELMRKLQKQQGLNQNQNSNVVMGEPINMQPLDSVQNDFIKRSGQQSEPIRKHNQTQSLQMSNQDVSQESRNLRDRIEAIEQELGESSKSVSTVTARAKVFLDEYGNETFYVENVSDGHIVVSDLDLNIPRGKSVDLLTMATLEDLKKSRDLRSMLAGDIGRSMLNRLTPEEYLIKKQEELSNKRKIEQMKIEAGKQTQQIQQQMNPMMQQQQVQNVENTSRIRPVVLGKLEKLRLSSIPGSAHLGMTYIEFTNWALTETLSPGELDFIITHPDVMNNSNSNEIRQALFEKRSKI